MRADKYFAEKFGSRTKAKEALMRGLVKRDNKTLSPTDEVADGQAFTFTEDNGFVSNGGYKLERGLEVFAEDVAGSVFADLGASTGGFTDCLLRRGAKRVYCVDVGESQLHESLAADSRVVVMDRTNARYLKASDFPEKIDGVVADLSFISLRLVLPAVANILQDGGNAFVLFKPQFECEGVGLGKSGILPERFHLPLLDNFYTFCMDIHFAPIRIVNVPLREKKNVEYIIFLKKAGNPAQKWEFLQSASEIFEKT